MRRRADNHDLVRRMGEATMTGATKSLAVFLIVAVGSAPLFASWHEAAVQHVRCAEHGELTHATAPHVHKVLAGRQASSSLQSEENADSSAGHDHCDVAFVARGRARVEVVRAVVRQAMPRVSTLALDVRVVPAVRERVWASAPKTSPPLI